ncbi:hypothetical protein CMI37_25470 [Candidatus Pacearchaeota archaeon]|nr:hypothetical protein [Candidatus Pacearchaeota archaeon]
MRILCAVLAVALIIAVSIIVVPREGLRPAIAPRSEPFARAGTIASLGSRPVLAEQPAEMTLEAVLVITMLRGQPSQTGRALVSNSNYHITTVTFPGMPAGKWDAELCVTATGPVGRAPLAIHVRALDTGWGPGTTQDQLLAEPGWRVSWTDGERIVVVGPGEYCVRLGGIHDYWQQVRDRGLVLMAESGQTAGVTYIFRGDLVRLHLRRE